MSCLCLFSSHVYCRVCDDCLRSENPVRTSCRGALLCHFLTCDLCADNAVTPFTDATMVVVHLMETVKALLLSVRRVNPTANTGGILTLYLVRRTTQRCCSGIDGHRPTDPTRRFPHKTWTTFGPPRASVTSWRSSVVTTPGTLFWQSILRCYPFPHASCTVGVGSRRAAAADPPLPCLPWYRFLPGKSL